MRHCGTDGGRTEHGDRVTHCIVVLQSGKTVEPAAIWGNWGRAQTVSGTQALSASPSGGFFGTVPHRTWNSSPPSDMECIALLTVSMPVMLLNAVVDVFIAEVYCTASAYPNATNAPRQSVDLQKQVATRPTVPGPKIAHLGPARTLVRYLNSISVRIKSTSAPLHPRVYSGS